MVTLDIQLRMCSGIGGWFPELDFECWIRSVNYCSKLLAIEPEVPLLESGVYTQNNRKFTAVEFDLEKDAVRKLAKRIKDAKLHAREPEVTGTDPDSNSAWWSAVDVGVTLGDESCCFQVGGVDFEGKDAEKLRLFFREVLEVADVKNPHVWQFLTGQDASAMGSD